jgi:hypothetical protein
MIDRVVYLYLTRADTRTESRQPATSTSNVLSGRLEAVVRTLDEGLQAMPPSRETLDALDSAYLFEDPLPQTVPVEWLAELSTYRVREDPDFVHPSPFETEAE